MADTGLLLGLRLDEAQDPKPRRIREDAKCLRERIGIVRVESAGEQRRAVDGERGDRFHHLDIDTHL